MVQWSAMGSETIETSAKRVKSTSGRVVPVVPVQAGSPTSTLDGGDGVREVREVRGAVLDIADVGDVGKVGDELCRSKHVVSRVSNASDVTTDSDNEDSESGAKEKDIFCPHLTPSREEFSRPFAEYMTAFFRKHPDCPCVRVTPPPGYQARRAPVDKESLQINAPIKQHVFGRSGAYMAVLEEQRGMTAAQYEVMAKKKDRQPPKRMRHNDDALMERSFWSGVTLNPPVYGADTVMSLFDEKVEFGWNLRDLGCLWKEYNVPQIGGVTTPMTYFGMWKAFFAWHKEDLDLYSINYLHTGAPKVWYCVPPSESDKFDAMARQLFPELAGDCSQFVRHKNILISPSLLRTFNIQYVQALQQPGDFIVINAQAYHSGYNLGYNCAEAVNFALEDWLEIGRDCEQCHCGALDEGVSLDMSIFFPGLYDDETSESEEEETDDSEESEESDGACSNQDDDASDNEQIDMAGKGRKQQKRHGATKPRQRRSTNKTSTKKTANAKSNDAAMATTTPSTARKVTPSAKKRSPAVRGSRQKPPQAPISLPREARHVTWGSVVDPKPMALITDTEEGSSFTLVHRLERPASRPDSAWFGVLEKDQDGLYVPKGETTLIQFGGENSPKLVDVRLQWTCPETRRRGAWKLRRGVKERRWGNL